VKLEFDAVICASLGDNLHEINSPILRIPHGNGYNKLWKEPGARSQEPGARSQEPGARSQEPGARSQEPGARSQERSDSRKTRSSMTDSWSRRRSGFRMRSSSRGFRRAALMPCRERSSRVTLATTA
jgi:hypothetical protein